MPINNKIRTVTEKITSVELPLEQVQYGVISYRVNAGATSLVIPTNIAKASIINLVALDLGTATILSSGWHSTLDKTVIANVTSVLGHTVAAATNVTPDSICTKDGILYECLKTVPSAQNPQNAVGVDSTMWQPIKFFTQSTSAENYLIIALRTAVAAQTTIRLAFEVRGYDE